MKRLACVLLVLLLLPVCAFADVDLSALSYDELLDLRTQLNKELISRPEWKEVTVPAGKWIVGEDIPAGFYSVKSANGDLARFQCEDKNGKDVEYKWLSKGDDIGKVELLDGYIVELTDPVIFAPPMSLGF